jgi:predicted transcriptional regulator
MANSASADQDPLTGQRSKGGGKLSRSETVTVRLDPKLNYLCELAARAQRRTKSSFIEWAIDHALKSVDVPGAEGSMDEYAGRLWDVDEVDRLIALAEWAPFLMTHEEQLIWKVIQQVGSFWRGKYDRSGEWTWVVQDNGCVAKNVRDYWEIVKSVADGRLPMSNLPKPTRRAKIDFDDLDENIPF